jgi:hypothetical protein
VFPVLTRVVIDKAEQLVKKRHNIYWEPRVRNYPAVDSVITIDPDASGLQMTVSLTHGVLRKPLYDILRSLCYTEDGAKFRLYFVVPTDKFAEYRTQPYKYKTKPKKNKKEQKKKVTEKKEQKEEQKQEDSGEGQPGAKMLVESSEENEVGEEEEGESKKGQATGLMKCVEQYVLEISLTPEISHT